VKPLILLHEERLTRSVRYHGTIKMVVAAVGVVCRERERAMGNLQRCVGRLTTSVAVLELCRAVIAHSSQY